jgi:LmbE family N-acetylglucosaminyl deacetylase
MKKTALLFGIFMICHAFAGATIVVMAPHPDDAESSCGGLIANATHSGERVIILSMTKGERGIGGKSCEEAAGIRQLEAENGAKVLGAEIEYFGAIDGSLYDDSTNTAKLRLILKQLNPSIVLAPWPLDVHNDHQATGILAWRVFHDRDQNFDLYFYETAFEPNTISFNFNPTDYVDVTTVMDLKREATLKHLSQNAAEWFKQYEIMAEFRGYEADVRYAEGYIRARNYDGMGGRAASVKKVLKP